MAKAINIPITGSPAPLRKALATAQNDLNRFGNQAGKTMKRAATAMLATGTAAAYVGMRWYKMAEQAYIADRRIERIAISMRLFGINTSQVTKRLQDYADALERETGVTAETIKASQAKLLTFRQLAMTADEAGGAFDRATQATIDMAAAGFGSAEQNAVQLGKALEDPIKGVNSLRRSGITFTEAEKKKLQVLVQSGRILQAQKVILGAVETQVKGTAKETASSTTRMKLAFGEVTDRIMSDMIPAMKTAADAMSRIGEKATIEGLGAAAKQTGKEIGRLTRNVDGTVNGFGRFRNANTRVTNGLITVANGFFRVGHALGMNDGRTLKHIKTLSDLTGEQRRLWLASNQYAETLSGIRVFTGQLVETQAQLNAVMGPVASRNIIDFKAYLEAYRNEVAALAQAENDAKAKEAARWKAFVDRVNSAKKALRQWIATVRDSITSSVSLSTAFQESAQAQSEADDNVKTALENRKQAYADLNMAQQTNDVDAYNAALAKVAETEKAVSDAQAVKPKNYTQIFAEQIAAAKDFAANLKTLAGQGQLSKEALSQLLSLGPVAGNQVVKDILAGTAGFTAQTLSQDLAAVAASGTGVAMAMPGVSTALTATPTKEGKTYQITVNAGVGDKVAIGKQVVEVLQAYEKQLGGIPIKVK